MKTVTIPFDLEMAKKIQNGEVEGKIVDKCKTEYEIVKWNAMGNYPLIGVFFDEESNVSNARSFSIHGKYMEKDSELNLQLELPWYLTYEDGQYVTIETKEYTYVLIYKLYMEGTTNPVHYHVFFNTTDKDLRFNSYCDDEMGVETIRPSTLSEIELIHELLKENGYTWNPETKRVEDVKKEPEHEFKPLDLCLAKFRDTERWTLVQFGYELDGSMTSVGGLAWNKWIPYEGNEHLLGTTSNPGEHED